VTGGSGGRRESRFGCRGSEAAGAGLRAWYTTMLKLMEIIFAKGRRNGFSENKFCGVGGGCGGGAFFCIKEGAGRSFERCFSI
jgi:hypothetical protein